MQFISVLKVITVPSILWEDLHCNINMQMNANPGHKNTSSNSKAESLFFIHPLSKTKCRVSYTKPCSTCKVHCLKTIYIADIITFKLPPSISITSEFLKIIIGPKSQIPSASNSVVTLNVYFQFPLLLAKLTLLYKTLRLVHVKFF